MKRDLNSPLNDVAVPDCGSERPQHAITSIIGTQVDRRSVIIGFSEPTSFDNLSRNLSSSRAHMVDVSAFLGRLVQYEGYLCLLCECGFILLVAVLIFFRASHRHDALVEKYMSVYLDQMSVDEFSQRNFAPSSLASPSLSNSVVTLSNPNVFGRNRQPESRALKTKRQILLLARPRKNPPAQNSF